MIYDVSWVRRLCGLTQVDADSKEEAAKRFYEMLATGEVCGPDAELGRFHIQVDGIDKSDDGDDEDDGDVGKRAYFTCPVNLDLSNDYPRLDKSGKTYAVWNLYSVELPPDMDDGEEYVEQLQAAGQLWDLAAYEDTHDSNGNGLDRPALPDLRDIVDYEDSY